MQLFITYQCDGAWQRAVEYPLSRAQARRMVANVVAAHPETRADLQDDGKTVASFADGLWDEAVA